MPDQRSIWERTYNRKGFVAISAMSAFLAACGGDDDGGSAAGDTTNTDTTEQLGGTLHYYNWADYVNPKTYPAFTKATGVKIKKDFFVSNEDLQAKLQVRPRRSDGLHGQDPRRGGTARARRLDEDPERNQEHRPEVQEPPVRPEG
jgi:ABC-type glycerol-3-phosphate transport system substrate-binding protein